MSVGNKPHYLDTNHPNYLRWKRSREISFERGKFVKSIIAKYKSTSKIKILDIGSGFGGTIQNFFDDTNQIYSVEIDEFKLSNQPEHRSLKKFNCDAFNLPFNEQFDVIILQDFIEHIEEPDRFLDYIKIFLKEDGIIYLSTPNRFSMINLISDPHWGFPFVSILSRKIIQKFFIPVFRRSEKYRKDFSALLSLKELTKIFESSSFDYKLHTIDATKTLTENPRQIIWSDFHLFLLRILKMIRIENFLIRISNNEIGFLNNYLTPTFYFVLMKRQS